MTIARMWHDTLAAVMHSPLLRGALTVGAALLLVAGVLALLVGVTWLLKIFFKRHDGIDRAHRFLIYLLTMLGVVILLFAGVLGLVLPLIPGFVLLLLALLLLRTHYKSRWVDRRIRWLRWRLRIKRGVRRARRRIARSKLGKILRRKKVSRKPRGDAHEEPDEQ